MTRDGPTVVSTTPSGTEICFALGVEPAAVSHACDFPPRARDLPVIDASAVDAGASADRDRQAGSGDVYDVDVELLARLAPDLIVTQSVCGVCAVDEALVEDHLAHLEPDPSVHPLSASTVGDVCECVRSLGERLDRTDRAASVVAEFEACLDQIQRLTAPAASAPSVVVLEWLDPLHAAGNWVPELIERAGGRSAVTEPGERSTELAWDRLRAVDPDVLVLAPCNFDRAATVAHIEELRDRPGWDELSAVREGRVHALDGRILNRWTPRLGGELERLAGILHPDRVDGAPEATRVA